MKEITIKGKCYDEDEDLQDIEFSVRYTKFYPNDSGDYTYEASREEETLSATSVERLYEDMAKLVIDYKIEGQREWNNWPTSDWINSYRIEFSNIFVEAEEFSQHTLENTETYKNIGKAQDEARKKFLKEEEEKMREQAKAKAKYLEENEKREYIRLAQKFGNKPV